MGEDLSGKKKTVATGKKTKSSSAARARREAKTQAAIRNLWIAALVILVIGLVLSVELVRLHFAAASDPSYRSYCAVNDTVSCDTVTRSKYSVAFGVPLAIWGVFGYALSIITAVFGLRTRSRVHAATFGMLAGFSLIVSLVLAAISHFRIHAWCLLCVGTYAVNVAVAIVSYRLLERVVVREAFNALRGVFQKEMERVVAIGALVGGAALAVILLFPQPHASAALVAAEPNATPAPEAISAAPAPDTASAAPAPSLPPIPPRPASARIEHGVTSDGLPWIGAANPVVTITEFFDYQCSHCQQAFQGLHELLEMNPDRLRLVVRHFPLDQHCNPSIQRQVYEHSCSYAQLANCAREQHRFWEAHEYLFAHADEGAEPKEFASALKLNLKALKACLGKSDQALTNDIQAGIALDLHGTPVFLVDGKAFMQRLPQSVVEQLRHP
jgi:protein-disulfide isomerase/uncharacterized membrane protein